MKRKRGSVKVTRRLTIPEESQVRDTLASEMGLVPLNRNSQDIQADSVCGRKRRTLYPG